MIAWFRRLTCRHAEMVRERRPNGYYVVCARCSYTTELIQRTAKERKAQRPLKPVRATVVRMRRRA